MFSLSSCKKFGVAIVTMIAALLFVVVYPTMAPAAQPTSITPPTEQPSASATEDPIVEYVPATDDDLPVGHVVYSAQGSDSASDQLANGSSESAMQSIINCTIYASNPSFGNPLVGGLGSQTCSNATDQTINVVLQRRWPWGTWQNMDSTPASGYAVTLQEGVAYNCQGAGSNTYRIVTNASFRDVGGQWYSAAVQSLNYLTVTC